MTRTENDLRAALGDLEQLADAHGSPQSIQLIATAEAPAKHLHHLGQRTDRHREQRWLAPLAAAAVVAATAVVGVVLTTEHGGSNPRLGQAAGRATSSPTAPPSAPATTPGTATSPRSTASAPRSASATARSTATPEPTTPSSTATGPRSTAWAPPNRVQPTVSTPTPVSTSAPTSATPTPSRPAGISPQAIAVLQDAAAKLDGRQTWATPRPVAYFYVHTTEATTWTSVSGTRAGVGHDARGVRSSVPGCKNGTVVADGQSGSCTLDDVPHYRADAPTTPQAWDAYLEQIAPGAKAAGAQGKIILQVLHDDLVAPKAAAALLRYTATCPGLRTLAVRPVNGQKLVGVTCTSMTNGSYSLVFRAGSHTFVGFCLVTSDGRQNGPAEIILKTGIVTKIGQTP